MAYGVLFGSRILPQRLARAAAPRVVSSITQRAIAASAPSFSKAFASSTTSALNGLRREGLRLSAQQGILARYYGTRSVWNVKKGRYMVFMWFGVFTVVAGVMQELAGPY